MIKRVTIGYRGYKGLQEFTEYYKWVTGVYMGLQRVTRGFKRF